MPDNEAQPATETSQAPATTKDHEPKHTRRTRSRKAHAEEGPDVDDLVLRDRDSTASGSLNERLYALQDANWNVTALADTGGVVQERYAYDGYGVPLVLTGAFAPRGSSSYDWETRFVGYRWDGETGLYQVRLRYYHAVLVGQR